MTSFHVSAINYLYDKWLKNMFFLYQVSFHSVGFLLGCAVVFQFGIVDLLTFLLLPVCLPSYSNNVCTEQCQENIIFSNNFVIIDIMVMD